MIEDFGLIVSSFQSQYGIRLSRDMSSMSWDEFKDLLIGIDHKTALGRIVAIRAENDKEVLKHFTDEQRKIRNDWRTKHKKEASIADRDEFLKQMLDSFKKMGNVRKAGES